MKKILFILFGLSLYSPIANAQDAPNNDLKKVDSVIVNKLLISLVDNGRYDSFDTTLHIGTKIYEDKVYQVYFYEDSIFLNVTPLKIKSDNATIIRLTMMGDHNLFGMVGGSFTFYHKPTNWYYFCPHYDADWFVKTGWPSIEKAITAH